MKLDITLRNMGPESTRDLLRTCARAAEEAGLDGLWVADHIAIPPDDAEGSNGRYLDPLATLAYLAAATDRIGLGVGVLVLPYREALPTAKWVATIQELSGGRMLLGAGVGWMEAEFRAPGVDQRRRGAIADATPTPQRCFAADSRAERPAVPLPAAPAATADPDRRCPAARAPPRRPLRRRLDADGPLARRPPGPRRRAPAAHGRRRPPRPGGRGLHPPADRRRDPVSRSARAHAAAGATRDPRGPLHRRGVRKQVEGLGRVR
jgi:alkanesulfonate monooxygenase SsuD/methylene tetrahydromethanopterin reductase-like flavin-dependent oxidoreductase (luciferase family)